MSFPAGCHQRKRKEPPPIPESSQGDRRPRKAVPPWGAASEALQGACDFNEIIQPVTKIKQRISSVPVSRVATMCYLKWPFSPKKNNYEACNEKGEHEPHTRK